VSLRGAVGSLATQQKFFPSFESALNKALLKDLSQLLDTALGLHKAGKLPAAKRIYEQILSQNPTHADALHFLGMLAYQTGRPRDAAALIRKAIASKPDVASYHNNLGKVLEEGGGLEAALASYREAARLEPSDADTRFNVGIVLQKLGRLGDAEASYRTALSARPNDAECHYNLANVLRDQGRLEPAVVAYRESLRLCPDLPHAHNNLGNVLHRLGRLQEAVQAHRQALALRPDEPGSHLNLGNDLRELGQPEIAREHYERALQLNPNFAEAHRSLGKIFILLGNLERAAEAFRQTLRLKLGDSDARNGLVSVFRLLEPTGYERTLEEEIKQCFAAAEVDHQHLARIVANQLKHKHSLHTRLRRPGRDKRTLMEDIAADDLLLALLAKTINVDSELELLLMDIRQWLFFDFLDAATIPESRVELLAALALQCFNNEYVFSTNDDEDLAIDRLKRECEKKRTYVVSQEIEKNLLLLALYQPLYGLACAQEMATAGIEAWSTPLRRLIQRTLIEPLEERRIEPEIESLGALDDPTSQAVRAQYEENPYPRWLDTTGYRPVSLRASLNRLSPHFTPPDFFDGPTRVLVAGCGTGQVPITIALTRTDTKIVALDLSRDSLAYGARMARKLGVNSIRFIQGDILQLSRLHEQFHTIESTGVLHHMDDPLQGWRALTDCLIPDGLMKIALYSERARSVIVAAREAIRERGLTPVSKDIKAFRHVVLTGKSELRELLKSEDFYTLSACRDLLFHVKEHRFTLPQIRNALDELRLTFIGFDLPTPQMKQRYRDLFPEDSRMTDLTTWEKFERLHPLAFAGMYVFWCQKADTS
jgi:Flp pilus assembly protein TadD/SAM-dependent methyltransferase